MLELFFHFFAYFVMLGQILILAFTKLWVYFFQIRFLDESSTSSKDFFFISQVRSFIQTGYLLFVQRLQKGKKVPLRRRFRICRSITKWANKWKKSTIIFSSLSRQLHLQFCHIIVKRCLLFVALKLDQSQASWRNLGVEYILFLFSPKLKLL